MIKQTIKELIHEIPDFPKPGVSFKDISPLLRDNFTVVIDELAALLTAEEWSKADYLVGVEARGFILASALAQRLNKNLVLIRKQGKLPGDIATISYSLEYGQTTLEMQHGKGTVIIVDDVLATGGTLTASANLATQAGYEVLGFATLINLSYLNTFRWQALNAASVINYTV